jgi:hypothetical protein
MRHDVAELERFPHEGAIGISVPLVRRLAPDSLSVMEFKDPTDVQIAEKMAKFPLLGEQIEGIWNVSFTAEFHMTNDSYLFKTAPGKGRLAAVRREDDLAVRASVGPPPLLGRRTGGQEGRIAGAYFR